MEKVAEKASVFCDGTVKNCEFTGGIIGMIALLMYCSMMTSSKYVTL